GRPDVGTWMWRVSQGWRCPNRNTWMGHPNWGPEPPTLLKSYRWRTAAPMGAERGAGSPGSHRWTRLQGWKRSYSHPEADGPNDGVGRGSSNLGAPKGSTRRSLFQRAFSAPTKGTKESRAPEGGKATLQRYLCSMAKRKGHGESGSRAEKVPLDAGPAPNGPVWDVSHFSLVDGHLVLVGRDEEVRTWGHPGACAGVLW
uniref:Uncharacterized protein n=1 Tax=Amazona collaria TaxID=241587 RepID=A0A8B9G7B7_9PSIT